MAYAPPRSPNRELEQGMVDGSFKQVIKDRGGFVERATGCRRDELSFIYYGICEAPVFDTPDAQKMTSPYATECRPGVHEDMSMSGILIGAQR